MSRQVGVRKLSLPWLRAVLISLGLALISAAFFGIIGNRADLGLTWLMDQLSNSKQQGSWIWWIIVGILVVVCIGVCLYSWQQITILNQTIERYENMLALDDSLLRFLGSWPTPSGPSTSPDNREKQLRRILEDALSDAIVEFNGDVERAAVLLPDPTDTWLECWAHYHMPPDSIRSMKFYIGVDWDKQRTEGGVAGAAFQRREILVGHMVEQPSGEWLCEDQRGFVPFRGDRPFQPYRSFVVVPIISPDCIGIVCFDSRSKYTFDSEEIKKILKQIARRVAAAILVSEKLV